MSASTGSDTIKPAKRAEVDYTPNVLSTASSSTLDGFYLVSDATYTVD